MNIVKAIVKRIAPYWSARRVSLLLTIIAIILWSYSTLQAELNIGLFGVIHSFPISFFVALALLTVASFILWVSPQNHEKLLFLQWSFLVAALFGNALLVGGEAWGTAPCPNDMFGTTEYINRVGHLFPEALGYHNWPASWIFTSVLMQITGMSNPGLMTAITPVALQFFFLLPLYLFFKNMLGEDKRNLVWAGAWIFVLGNWVATNYLSAAAFGYFLFLTALFLLIKISPWQRSEEVPGYQARYLLLLILVLACLPLTHLFTSFIVLSIIIALYVARKAKASSFFSLPMTMAVFVVAWTIYGSITYVRVRLPLFIFDTFRLDIAARVIEVSYATASASYQAIAWTRIVTGMIFVLIAFAGFILGRKVNRSSNITALAIAAGILTLSLFIAWGYGHEIVHRTYWLMLPVMAYFGVKLLNRKAWALLLCILLVVLLPLHFICHYGGPSLSPSEISGAYFFNERVPHGCYFGDDRFGSGKNSELRNNLWSEWLNGDFGYPKGDMMGYLNWLAGLRGGRTVRVFPHYVAMTKNLKYSIKFHFDDPEFMERLQNSLDNAPGVNLFYVNPNTNVYIYQPVE